MLAERYEKCDDFNFAIIKFPFVPLPIFDSVLISIGFYF
jgi:hypothetical protein